MNSADPNEQHLSPTEDLPENYDLGPGNEGKEWARRNSETEMRHQGNRLPELRGILSPGHPPSPVNDDDLPEWLRLNKNDATDPQLASSDRW